MPKRDSFASDDENSALPLAKALVSHLRAPAILSSSAGDILAVHPKLADSEVTAWSEAISAPTWAGRSLRIGETLRLLVPTAAEITRVKTSENGDSVLLITPEPPPETGLKITRLAHDLRVLMQVLTLSHRGGDGPQQSVVERALDYIEALLSPDQSEAVIFDLSEELRQTVSLLAPLHEAQSVFLTVNCPPGLVVEGRKMALRKLVQNLIQNAARQSSGGAVVLTLTATPMRSRNMLFKLSVTDSGPGLPANLREALADGAPLPTPEKGHGYGLGIVLEAVKTLSGSLNSEPGPPHAMVVRFRMPQAYGRAHDLAPAVVGKRLILIEDDLVVRDLLARMLGSHGIDLRLGASLEDLREILSTGFRPDCVVLDYMLGDGTAVPLLRELRTNAYEGPIFVLTGDETTEVRDTCLAAGANEVLLKPISLDRLLGYMQQNLIRMPLPVEEPLALLDAEIVENLLEELGPESAASFMRRALNEASALIKTEPPLLYDKLRQPVHSAIGANAMTGLGGVVDALKAFQTALKAREPVEPSLTQLKEAIVATDKLISLLPGGLGAVITKIS